MKSTFFSIDPMNTSYSNPNFSPLNAYSELRTQKNIYQYTSM